MNTEELELIIKSSLADFKLDLDEKYVFKALSQSLDDDQLRFIRNKAFELARDHIAKTDNKQSIQAFIWLEKVIKAIQTPAHATSVKSSAYFSPGDDCRNKIINLIEHAKKSIKICVFTISDNNIVNAILAAHKRKVSVTIISDNDKSNDKGSDIASMTAQGIHIILDDSPYHMHHKFALFDDKILLNGSFNWTRSAGRVNQENILVSSETHLVKSYSHQFDALLQQFS